MITFVLVTEAPSNGVEYLPDRNGLYLTENAIIPGHFLKKFKETSGTKGLFIQGDVPPHHRICSSVQNYDSFIYVQEDVELEAQLQAGGSITCRGKVGPGVILHTSAIGYIDLNDIDPQFNEARIPNCLYAKKKSLVKDKRTYTSNRPYFFFENKGPIQSLDFSVPEDVVTLIKGVMANKLNGNQVVETSVLLKREVTLEIYDILPLFHWHVKKQDLNILKFYGAAIDILKGNKIPLQLARIKALVDQGTSNEIILDSWKQVEALLKPYRPQPVSTHQPLLTVQPAVMSRPPQVVSSAPPQEADPLVSFLHNAILRSPKITNLSEFLDIEFRLDPYEILIEYEGLDPDVHSSDLLFAAAAIEYVKNNDRAKQVDRLTQASKMNPPSQEALNALKMLQKSPAIPEPGQALVSSSTKISMPEYQESDLDWDKKEFVAQGGSARVYRVSDKRFHGHYYAVKCDYHPGISENSIRKEAVNLLNVQHPSIVRLYGLLLSANKLVIAGLVMEYMAGGSLFNKLHPKNGIFQADYPTKFKMAMDLSSALAWLHSRDVLHRDLKSPNVLISDDGTLKLTDFGTSKDETTHQTTTKAVEATLIWSAPEVIDDCPRTKESDIYALAMILWEIETGKIPYQGEAPTSIIRKKAKGEILPCSSDSPFKPLIDSGLHSDPKNRKEAKIFMEELTRLRDNSQTNPVFQTSGMYLKK